jgi:hypothetical protein
MSPEWEELERRIARIEQVLGIAGQASSLPAPSESPASVPKLETTALLPILGRALLGLAGAYLLRALTESGVLPHELGVAVGLAYALFWLLWAARTPAAQKLEAALHSLTAVLVLAPLLWEAALRFHAVSTWMAGAILLFFTLFGLIVSWRKDLLIVATISTIAGLGTAAALLVATHDVVPFTCVILTIAAAVEICACLDHWLSERWLAAAAADLSVVLATWLVTNPRGLPETYVPIPHGWLLAAQIVLLAIYLASIIFRTLLHGSTFTVFEILQCAAVFLISARAMPPVTLCCGAACYLVAFRQHGRNYHVYSSFGAALLLVGLWTALPLSSFEAILPALAVCGAIAGRSLGSLTLQVHGAVCLIPTIVTGGVPGAAAAVLCYALAIRTSPAFNLALAGAALWLLAGLAGFRTPVIGAAALLLAWSGARWKRLELGRLAYPAMLLAGYRLLMFDLHRESKAALFLSLLVYGVVLIILPRVKRAL